MHFLGLTDKRDVGRCVLHLITLVLGLATITLYSSDLTRVTNNSDLDTITWVCAFLYQIYAVVVGITSVISSVCNQIPEFVGLCYVTYWNACILGEQVVLFVGFHKYLTIATAGDNFLLRNKIGAWIDLVAMVAWFTAFVVGCVRCSRRLHMPTGADDVEAGDTSDSSS